MDSSCDVRDRHQRPLRHPVTETDERGREWKTKAAGREGAWEDNEAERKQTLDLEVIASAEVPVIGEGDAAWEWNNVSDRCQDRESGCEARVATEVIPWTRGLFGKDERKSGDAGWMAGVSAISQLKFFRASVLAPGVIKVC